MSDTCVGSIGVSFVSASCLMSMRFQSFGPDAVHTLSSCASSRNHGAAAHSHGPSCGIGRRVGPRPAPALLVVAAVHLRDDGLGRQPGHERVGVVRVLHLVDLPALRRGAVEVGHRRDELEVGLLGRHLASTASENTIR